jgi:heptosyltransferase-2
LTDSIKDIKYLGEKHEVEYNLDVIRRLGISPKNPKPFIPIKQAAERYIEDILNKNNILREDKIVILNPSASCVSKRWPEQRFYELGDELIRRFCVKIIIVSSQDQKSIAGRVAGNMKDKALNLAGMTTISQLSSLLKRAKLFISNDSGPVHIAAALDIPVISIFGRRQPGLGHKRWGPLGPKTKFLHKDVGCVECLAHNCIKEFTCLKAITVDDVIKAARQFLEE